MSRSNPAHPATCACPDCRYGNALFDEGLLPAASSGPPSQEELEREPEPSETDLRGDIEWRERTGVENLIPEDAHILRLARYALRLKQERDTARTNLTLLNNAVHQSQVGYDVDVYNALAKLAATGAKLTTAEAELAALRSHSAELSDALRDAIYTVSSGRVASMGGLGNTYTPQISKEHVERWRAVHDRTALACSATEEDKP